jgi:hypothetical protein
MSTCLQAARLHGNVRRFTAMTAAVVFSVAALWAGHASPVAAQSVTMPWNLSGYDCEAPYEEGGEYTQFIGGQHSSWLLRLVEGGRPTDVVCVKQLQPVHGLLDKEAARTLLGVSRGAATEDAASPASQRSSVMRAQSTAEDGDVYLDAVGVLALHFDGADTVICTGILLDPGRALTSANCVYDATKGGYAASGEFYPGRHLPPTLDGNTALTHPLLVLPGGFAVPASVLAGGQAVGVGIVRLAQQAAGRLTYLPLRAGSFTEFPACCQTIGYDDTSSALSIRVARDSDVFSVAAPGAAEATALRITSPVSGLHDGAPIFAGASATASPQSAVIVGIVTHAALKTGRLITQDDLDLITGK